MSSFEDKYHLTSEQSIFLAKKKWDENVYCGMKMENRAVTFVCYGQGFRSFCMGNQRTIFLGRK